MREHLLRRELVFEATEELAEEATTEIAGLARSVILPHCLLGYSKTKVFQRVRSGHTYLMLVPN